MLDRSDRFDGSRLTVDGYTPTLDSHPRRIADFDTLGEALDYAAGGSRGMNFHDARGTLLRSYPYSELRTDALAHAGEGAAQDNAGVTMRYRCDAGTEVTVLADGTAQVALPDGQQVVVSRIAGSAPPVFSGGSIYFTVGEDGARLSQDDAANELTCTPL